MKKLFVSALAAGAIALTAPAAFAVYEIQGGCSFASISDAVAGEGQQTGEIDIEAVVYNADPTANPVSATITCFIRVNGAAQPGATVTASGTVVVAGGGVITYTSSSTTDFVELCQTVTFTGGKGTQTTTECFEATTIVIPPPIIWELVDPIVCPVLASLAPGVGPIVINDQGDVYVAGEPQYDCPPYDIWPPA